MSLRHALLGLLVTRSSSGYDLMKLFNTSLANVWPATQSQVYGELNRLADAGLVEVVDEGPRGRKQYALTDTGEKELRRWLVENKGEKPHRNAALLQVFFLGVLPREQAVERLRHHGEVAAGQHAALTEIDRTVDWDTDSMSVHGRLALEYGLRLRVMEQEWASWAADQLLAGPDAPTRPGESEEAS